MSTKLLLLLILTVFGYLIFTYNELSTSLDLIDNKLWVHSIETNCVSHKGTVFSIDQIENGKVIVVGCDYSEVL